MSEAMIETRELQTEIAPVVQRATEITIAGQPDRLAAMDLVKAVKAGQKKATDFFRPMKQAADESKRRILDAEKLVMGPLMSAETILKQKLIAYDTEQDRIRIEQQRRLQAEADARAEAERRRLEKEAEKLKTPELKEARLEQAAAVVAPVVQIAAPVKQNGESTRTLWKARLVSLEQLTGLPAGDLRLSFVTFDQTAANRFATSTKGAVNVPGVEFYSETSLAIRV